MVLNIDWVRIYAFWRLNSLIMGMIFTKTPYKRVGKYRKLKNFTLFEANSVKSASKMFLEQFQV